MKSQRRHDLQTNTLSRQMNGLPEIFRQYSSKILLGLTLLVLVVVLIRYRSDAARQRGVGARIALSRAHTDLQQLQAALQSSVGRAETIGPVRNQLRAQCLGDLGDVLSNTEESDATLRAEAYATRGDLYWALANSPVFPEAATQPSLALPEPPEALLAKAESDYKHILDQYQTQTTARLTAEFALAAIAENRGNWDDARKRYQEIENNADTSEIFKENAKVREGLLDRIREPLQIGSLTTQATTQPTTEPTTQASLGATTMPAINHASIGMPKNEIEDILLPAD